VDACDVTTPPPPPPTPVCQAGLVGLWSGEGNADDSVGENDGTSVNVAYASGVTGQAFVFSADGYVDIPHSTPLFFGNDQAFTLEAWFRPLSETPAYFVLMNAGYGVMWRGTTSPLLFYNGNNHLSVRNSWQLGHWYHVAVVDDGIGTVTLYVDGVLDSVDSANYNRFPCLPSYCFPLQIGAWYEPDACGGGGVCNSFFGGEVDEVRVYNRALTAREVDPSDLDNDREKDVCDLDDGYILTEWTGPSTLGYQLESGFVSFNVYRGDLTVLHDVGVYTQDPATVVNADRFCGVTSGNLTDPFMPATGQGVYYLVSGLDLGGAESGIGQNSSGSLRPNHNPCP
jgi:hypothetical protein